ncbi:hypothetical protein A3J78_01735 [Candidatus Beckwithbacteria bacterium RBG_13_35_6]|uniref:DUF5667 domain-containing protein n=1 Tax=Candidatus Beckwithbacteria bacterium RBG_13_35_6 TaxID=1797456 RepID=A0A1F5DGM6_9BACT|nr:MAG: hypothetical protein A3J78_01735 [Candidatus Beckwithbacteria bacterium RBG_13_35_6]
MRETKAQSELGMEMMEFNEVTNSAEASETGELTVSKEVDYYLPYPGILPDHPLYWLKMIRDRVLLMLAREPAAKMDRLLLYADKRLRAAQELVNGNKIQLGITTLTKAEKYLEEVNSQYQKVKADNKDTAEMKDKLQKAVLKHQQVMQQLLEKVPDQGKAIIEESLLKIKSFSF